MCQAFVLCDTTRYTSVIGDISLKVGVSSFQGNVLSAWMIPSVAQAKLVRVLQTQITMHDRAERCRTTCLD